MQKIFQTDKFTLRPFTLSDAEGIANCLKDKEVSNNLLVVPYPYSLDNANKWLTNVVERYKQENPTVINYAIDINGIAVGSIGMEAQEPYKAKIGYWLAKDFWGQGIMSEVVKLISDYALNDLGFDRIEAGVFERNPASKRVLEKAGFVQEGFLKNYYKKDGELINAYMMAKTKI